MYLTVSRQEVQVSKHQDILNIVMAHEIFLLSSSRQQIIKQWTEA